MKKTKSMNEYVAIYKDQMDKGDIQAAYEKLVKFVMMLKAHFSNVFADKYSIGNVSPGYMDYTYFPFFNDFLRVKKLRFGIVLNYKEMCFELWLMGQNAQVQQVHWDLLKETAWNRGRDAMPRYSVLEAVLVKNPDFDDLDALTMEIERAASDIAEKVLSVLS